MKTLVLGNGNPSRRDDGAGWCLLREPQGPNLPDLEWITSQHLDLVFAEIVRGFDRVFFVDAAAVESSEPIDLSEIQPHLRPQTTTHHLVPGELLALCVCLHDKKPRGMLYGIRGEIFGFADEVSPQAADATRRVAEEIVDQLGVDARDECDGGSLQDAKSAHTEGFIG